MPKAAIATEKPEWLSKEAAAKLLGVSPRQVERREAQGFVLKRTEPRLPTESWGRVTYSRADLEALKAGKPNVHAREVAAVDKHADAMDAEVTALRHRHIGAPDKMVAGAANALALRPLDAYLQQFYAAVNAAAVNANGAPTPAPRPWLTLAEAVEYSGLPARWLVAAAQAGDVRAINVGTGERAFWRFNREGLAK